MTMVVATAIKEPLSNDIDIIYNKHRRPLPATRLRFFFAFVGFCLVNILWSFQNVTFLLQEEQQTALDKLLDNVSGDRNSSRNAISSTSIDEGDVTDKKAEDRNLQSLPVVSVPELKASTGNLLPPSSMSTVTMRAQQNNSSLNVATTAAPDLAHPLRFYFVHTTDESTFLPHNARAIESVFFHHPDANVTLFIKHENMTAAPVQFLIDAGYHLHVQTYQVEDLLLEAVQKSATTAAAEPRITKELAQRWIDKIPFFRTTKNWYTNETNLMRLLSLFLFGGVYLDTDMIVTNPLYGLSNVLGMQDPIAKSINGAVLAFPKPGNSFLQSSIVEYLSDFRPLRWGYNGPQLMTRILHNDRYPFQDCAWDLIPKNQTKKEDSDYIRTHPFDYIGGNNTKTAWQQHAASTSCPLTVLPADAFYPICK
jgi:hypothetical protein